LPSYEAQIEALARKIERMEQRLQSRPDLQRDPRIPELATAFDVEDALFNSHLLIKKVVLTSAAQTLAAFVQIPTTFRNLRVVFFGTSDTSADTLRYINLLLNGDAGTNYHLQVAEDGVQGTALNAARAIAGRMNGAAVGHQTWGVVDIIHSGETTNKAINAFGGYIMAGDIIMLEATSLYFGTGVPVNAVTILSENSATKFNTGSVAYLYGG